MLVMARSRSYSSTLEVTVVVLLLVSLPLLSISISSSIRCEMLLLLTFSSYSHSTYLFFYFSFLLLLCQFTPSLSSMFSIFSAFNSDWYSRFFNSMLWNVSDSAHDSFRTSSLMILRNLMHYFNRALLSSNSFRLISFSYDTWGSSCPPLQ